MPTSGTHITILQRLVIENPSLKELLGDPLAVGEDSAIGRRARYANLGAVGPDIFYAMADYGPAFQDFENIMIKVGGTFECVAELMEKVNRYITGAASNITLGVADSLEATFNLLGAVFREGFISLFVDAGFNAWPFFEPKRQQDYPRERWYWADYLHYVRTGQFVRALLENSRGNPNLHAYALGYLTHYVTDVVGHPYVNQVVQAPWRLYWQRHHLVENFIDAYVWDRWHRSFPPPPPPSTEEQPLDAVTGAPNSMGSGAPFTFSRLNDHINVGSASLGDPLDALVEAVCSEIENGTFDIFAAENATPASPSDADFQAWTQLVAASLQQVYNEPEHPTNLAGLLGRTGGYPSPDDVAAAYGAFRLLLKVTTEEGIEEPVPPDIKGDISAAVQKLANDISQDLGSIPPFPVPSTDGGFSFDSLWNAVKNTAKWLADAAQAIAKTIFDFIKDAIMIGVTAAADIIKYGLYVFNKLLFSLYRSFRDVLVLAAYSPPFTEELAINIGALNTSSLWQSPGDPQSGAYPVEETAEQRKYVRSSYAPFIPPQALSQAVEQPPVSEVAPYLGLGEGPVVINHAADSDDPSVAMPDQFIDNPSGPDDMFTSQGPEPAVRSMDPRAPNSFSGPQKDFGGAITNCLRAIRLAEAGFPGEATLPDYNLDGDRGYAWPTWDVAPAPTGDPPSDASANNPNAGDPLNPTDPANAPGEAHVNAVQITS